MLDTFLWTLLILSVATLLGGLAFSRRQREAGLMAALVGAVTGLFALGFVAGHLG